MVIYAESPAKRGNSDSSPTNNWQDYANTAS